MQEFSLPDVRKRTADDANDFASLDVLQPEMFDRLWGRATGLTPKSLLNDPMWLLYIKRLTIGFPASALSTLRKYHRSLEKRVERRRQRIALRHARRLAHASQSDASDVAGLATGSAQGREP